MTERTRSRDHVVAREQRASVTQGVPQNAPAVAFGAVFEPGRRRPAISVVIPAFQAESTIASVIRGIPAFVRDIIVVDDASTDGTGQQARSVGDQRVTVLKRDVNGGVGSAVVVGYAKAAALGSDCVVKMDADGQMDPQYLVELLAPVVAGRADNAKGNRFVHRSDLRRMPLVRRLGNIGLSFLTKLASGYWSVFDPTNGYTAVAGGALKKMNLAALSPRYLFETSMLVELGLAGAVVVDVQVPALYAGAKSGLSEVRSLVEFPPFLVRSVLRRFWIQHFVRDFSLLAVFLLAGTALCAAGTVFGLFHWYRSYLAGVPTVPGTVMIAAVLVVFGAQCLLEVILLDVQNQPTEPLTRRLLEVASVKAAVEGEIRVSPEIDQTF